MAVLRRGLAEYGYVEGKNLIIVPSWGDGNLDRLPELAEALVAARVDLILTDGTGTARAARAATTSIPIVMAGGNDPVQAGLVTSLSRPGGNFTGFTTQVIEVTGKAFEILTQILPGFGRIGVINLRGLGVPFLAPEAKAAQTLGLELKYFEMPNLETSTIDATVRQAHQEVQAAMVRGSPFFSSAQRKVIVDRAVAYRLPTMYETRDFVELGGLVSYGSDFADLFRLAAGYIVKILNGTSAGDLPIEQATKFELVINLTTAKKLGLTIPASFLSLADELVE